MFAEWNLQVAGANDHVSENLVYRRRYFLSILLAINLSPIIIFWFVYAFIKQLRLKEIGLHQALWLLPFFYLFFILQYKTLLGDVNLHPRYSYTFIFLLSPHFAVLWPKRKKWPLVALGVIVLFNFSISFIYDKVKFENLLRFHPKSYDAVRAIRHYNLGNEYAIPILKDKEIKIVKNSIVENINEDDGLIIDFDTWENTYYLNLHSGNGLKSSFLVIIDALKNQYSVYKLSDFTDKNPNGILVLRKNSSFNKKLVYQENNNLLIIENTLYLNVDLILNSETHMVFHYNAKNDFKN